MLLNHWRAMCIIYIRTEDITEKIFYELQTMGKI